jgi:hypothetical protein
MPALWFPKTCLSPLQAGYNFDKIEKKFENFDEFFVFDASRIYNRFKHLIKNDNEKDKKIKLKALFHMITFFKENAYYLSAGVILVFDEQEKTNIKKEMNLVKWEDDSYKEFIICLQKEKIRRESPTMFSSYAEEGEFFEKEVWTIIRENMFIMLENNGITDEHNLRYVKNFGLNRFL